MSSINYSQPSAPVYEAAFPQQYEPSAPAVENNEDRHSELDNCSICLEKCTDHPEANTSLSKTLAKTECNHFFHDFCLESHLKKGMNKLCPNCRHDLEGKRVTKMWVNAQGQAEVLKSSQAAAPAPAARTTAPRQRAQADVEDETPSEFVVNAGEFIVSAGKASGKALSTLGWLTGQGLKLGARALGNGAKWAFIQATTPKRPVVVAMPPSARPDPFVEINKEFGNIHKEMSNRIQSQQDAVQMVIAQAMSKSEIDPRNKRLFLDQLSVLKYRLKQQSLAAKRENDFFMSEVQRIKSLFR